MLLCYIDNNMKLQTYKPLKHFEWLYRFTAKTFFVINNNSFVGCNDKK